MPTYTHIHQRFQPLEKIKQEISPRLIAIIANVSGADQLKNREIIENVWKIWKILSGEGSQKCEVSCKNRTVGNSDTYNLHMMHIVYICTPISIKVDLVQY